MKVATTSGCTVTLTQQHYVATGGQASVYVRGDTAYKIYTDPKDSIPEQKLRALQQISDANVIRPLEGLVNEKGSPVGYSMLAVAERKTLGQLFTKAFRNRNGITVSTLATLTQKLRDHVSNVHASKALVVDLNPFNVLVPEPYTDAFMIDVDSYQAAGFPATVILPSVRDYSVSASQFSELSDWYSFAVLAFNLFIGCHPYRGGYPGLEALTPEAKMVHRMRGHLSAFRPEAKVPDCCYPVSDIPGGLRAWLQAVLDDGKRLAPPTGADMLRDVAVVTSQPKPAVAPLASGQTLGITEVMSFDGWDVLQYIERAGKSVALVGLGGKVRVIVDGRIVSENQVPEGELFLAYNEQAAAPFVLSFRHNFIWLLDARMSRVASLEADAMSEIDGRFHVKNGGSVYELYLTPNTLALGTPVANVMENATTLHSGCAIQSMFGATYVSLFTAPGEGHQFRVKELDGARLIDAKFHGQYFLAIVDRVGSRELLTLSLSDAHAGKPAKVEPAGDVDELNFVALQSGIHALSIEDGKLRAFNPLGRGVEFKDARIGTGTRLMVCNGKLAAAISDKILSISTTKG